MRPWLLTFLMLLLRVPWCPVWQGRPVSILEMRRKKQCPVCMATGAQSPGLCSAHIPSLLVLLPALLPGCFQLRPHFLEKSVPTSPGL